MTKKSPDVRVAGRMSVAYGTRVHTAYHLGLF